MLLHGNSGRDVGLAGTCWFHAGTGLYCPFCGSLRGVAALTHGDLFAALHDNAPVMLLLGAATLIWGRRMLFALYGRVIDQPRTSGRTNLAIVAFFVVFAIYRNTGPGAWLAPLS